MSRLSVTAMGEATRLRAKREADAHLIRELAYRVAADRLRAGELSRREAITALREAYRRAFLQETAA